MEAPRRGGCGTLGGGLLDGQFLCGVIDMKGPPWRARDLSCVHCSERETGKDGYGRRLAWVSSGLRRANTSAVLRGLERKGLANGAPPPTTCSAPECVRC